VNTLGWGSAGTPPWVDEKAIDEEKHVEKDSEKDEKIKALEKENAKLKRLITELENTLKTLEK
jgi:predicted RNase H-like nuclease (RuvC/YqgF family)